MRSAAPQLALTQYSKDRIPLGLTETHKLTVWVAEQTVGKFAIVPVNCASVDTVMLATAT